MTAARYLTAVSVAALVGVKPCTLAMWRVRGEGPKFVKFGSSQQARVRYSEAEVQAWLEGQTFQNTGESHAA